MMNVEKVLDERRIELMKNLNEILEDIEVLNGIISDMKVDLLLVKTMEDAEAFDIKYGNSDDCLKHITIS